MCGIAGAFSAMGPLPSTAHAQLRLAARELRHRGPDEFGIISLEKLCAAHTRLSIIDLASGQQPMTDPDTGNVIVFNGEIYNYVELREDLRRRGYQFRTESDTEVLLKSFACFGEGMLERLNGMFAFALFDCKGNRLILARDRFGEKPIYYCICNSTIYFASELGAIDRLVECGGALRSEAILEYFMFGFISGAQSIRPGILQLGAGTVLVADVTGVRLRRYYERRTEGPRIVISDDEIESSLDEAIRLRLRADVPVAVLLSGGLDSSLITLLAQRHSSQQLKSFSFGWAGDENEFPFAREVARRAETDHNEVELNREAFSNDIAEAIRFMDMPQADSACFVVFQLSKHIREWGVKVVLSGDGGDELFGGYDWYVGWDSPRAYAQRLLRSKFANAKNYVTGKATIQADELEGAFGVGMISRLIDERVSTLLECGTGLEGRIGFDYELYLPWMLMPKVDRMSMAHSIEIRAPLLDHTLVDRWGYISEREKVVGMETKFRIKRFCVARGLLSKDFLSRRKSGMNLPLAWWIRSNEALFRDTLQSQSSLSKDFFPITQTNQWFNSVIGDTNAGWTRSAQSIWSAFVFELWSKGRKEN